MQNDNFIAKVKYVSKICIYKALLKNRIIMLYSYKKGNKSITINQRQTKT